MVALFTASSSPLSFTLFVVILSASIIFGGEIVVAQKKPPLSCASSLAPGNEKCDGGFCFDLFDIQSDSIKSGCTHSPTKCPSSGCFLLPNAQKFLCCCSHPFCNGKSPYLIKARWRMYLKGDYPAKVLRKSPRDVSREMAEDNIRNVDSMENGTTKTMATKKATTPASVKMATTTMKKAPTASSSTQKPTTTKTAMTTKKPAIVNKTITTTKSPNNSTKTIKTTKTTKATVPTTNSPPKTTQKTSTLAINLTEFGANKSEEQIEEKGMEILDFNGNETNSKEKEENTVDSGTTVAAKIEKEMPKATTEKMMDVKNSTLLPSSSTMMRTKVTPKQSTTISGPFEITKVSTLQMNETTTIQSKSTNSPSSTSPKNENVPMFSSTAKSTSIKPSYSEPFTAHSSSKRTTRSPSPQPPTTIRTTLGPWEPAVPSFPWYFIALAGFLSSSAVFLLVYWTVKGCRRIFQKRMRNGRRGGDDGGQLGEPMIPMGNGQNSNGKKSGKTTKMEKENRPKKRAVPKANGQMMMSSKTTNESLMSQCTASTGIGEQQQQKISEIDIEYGGGEQVTVIDPLLNQQYNGTMNK